MTKVINVVGEKSNVGKTLLIEGVIKELKKRGLSVATIKHDVHGFDIDLKGKDTYRHREAGAETVVISSKDRLAFIKEVREELELHKIIKMVIDKDIVLVEGYKSSNLRKIEVYRHGVSNRIITAKERLIAIASDISLDFGDVIVIDKNNYNGIVDIIENEMDFS